ncbi:MAG: pyroglutamyl-peptidase I, partial [Oscillospiraceae bacterium]|nr:pyroglutamyl-peptidase I [Oscillospiraceae bacterium]
MLITGFEPFGGETVNPSWEAVKALDGEIGSWRLVRLCLPVEFGRAARLAAG